MTKLTRPLGMTQTRQLLTFPANGYAPTVTAYLWGAGGGAGGSDGPRQGGAGTGGGYVRADFTVSPGDTIEITVGQAGGSGRASNKVTDTVGLIFNTRTSIPTSGPTALPKASSTYISKWSAFLNQTSVWNTGTAVDGTTTDLSHTLTFDQSFTVDFPFTIDYVYTLAAYYQATVYLDGVELFSSGLNSWITQETFGVPFTTNMIAGLHTVRIVATAPPDAQYGVFGVGLTITSTGSAGGGGSGLNRTIFDTRNTPATPPLTIPDINILINSGKTGSYSNLMNDFGMWESNATAATCSRSYSVYFPYTAYYTLEMCAANTATVTVDGATVFTTPGTVSYTTSYTTDILVNQGYHTVAFTAALSDPTIIGGVAIRITKSWSGATGGQAGVVGSSGGGGGSGGATTLILNPYTTNETLLAVAVGGAGGGGAGATTVGQGQATAPGPRGLSTAGKSNGQLGENQGLYYQDGGGGGGGGPGGPTGAGNNGYSGVGDSYGQAGALGVSYRNTSATTGGEVIEPSGVTPGGVNTEYYTLIGSPGKGATSGQLGGQNGAAMFVVDAYGIQVRDDAIDSNWKDVKTAFVNVNGQWRQTFAAFVWQNNQWQMVIGGAALTFAGATTDYGVISRPSDYRPAPPPPPPPVVYDSVRVGCFVAGTLITMANGSSKPIEDVGLGEVVVGKDGAHNTVLAFLRPILGDTGASLMAFNGGKPFVTSDHPVWVQGRGWCSWDPEMTFSKYAMTVGKYQVGNVIETEDGSGFEIASIEEYSNQDPDQVIYTFEVSGNNTYIANGLVVHNKGRTGLGGDSCSSTATASCSAASSGCFVSGTEIHMADGSIKLIEDVVIGDQLIGKDGNINTVLAYIRPVLGSRSLISFNNGVPFITDDHPVLMADGSWKSVDPDATLSKYAILSDRNIGQLQVGDTIATPDGAGFEIASIERHQHSADLQLYNFSLDGDHTYVANNLVVHNKCFVAGTEVLMEDGSWKNIEDVAIDEVLIGKDGSRNQILKLHRPKLGVNDHWLPRTQRMVSINGSEFATSEDHMFFTTAGWKAPDAESSNLVHRHTIEAEGFTVTDLQVGDKIITDNGDTVEVISMEFREDDPELQLYNFWTNGNHTYHVRLPGSDQGMLVHNKCFVAGTKVLMQDGTWKNIEDVELGESLIGENNTVNLVREFHRPTLGLQDHMLPRKLSLVSINGSEFSVSADHLFKTVDGWKAPDAELSNMLHKDVIKFENMNVQQLAIGDKIINADGSTHEVLSIEFQEDDPELQLYNFKLKNNRTYHVKLKGSDQSYLVHNKGVCFIGNTMVTMSDGNAKPICDVKIGDLVLNHDHTKINQVLFVEKQIDSSFGFLYSPDSKHAPFATANHPLYINGRLSSLDPEKTSDSYPWLGHTDPLHTTNTAPAAGSTVYNLWTSGDHTFIVNGYGTTSMVGNGGVLRLLVEQKLISSSRASELLVSFDGLGKHTVYGLYALSQALGKIDIKLINKIVAWVFADDARPVAQKVFYRMARVVGSAICFIKKI